MADIELTLDGDASGAAAAFSQTATATAELASTTKSLEGEWDKLEQSGQRQEAQLTKVKAGFLAVGAAALKFGIDSVHAYAEAERVSRQLERAAGDLAGAFEQQADALEAALNIDGELIKQQQTLLLQWGAAPSAIEPTIRAIEDYAAATGKDALTATMELIKGVETGGEKFKALGIQYDATGDQTKDLAALTAALAEKFGGAAETDAKSLAGSVRGAEIAFGNLQEAFGGLVGAMESKLGVLSKVSAFLQSIARQVSVSESLSDVVAALGPGGIAIAAGTAYAGTLPQAPEIQGTDRPVAIHLPGFDPNKPAKKKGGGGSPRQKADESKKASAEIEQHIWSIVDEKEKADAALERLALDQLSFDRRIAKQQDDDELKRQEETAKQLEKAAKDSLERTKSQEREAAAAGDAIGAAMVNALADQLSKLAEGGEFDAALFVGDILAAALGIAGTVIGTALGAPAVGAALGNLAAMGARAGASAISKSGKRGATGRFHDGGWVGAPRYHDGSWIGGDEQRAILQTGERVLSRKEVGNMGGPKGVDSAAKGRGSVSVTIHAIDSKSAADSFASDLGRGLRQAIRSGRGDVPSLLGVNPR